MLAMEINATAHFETASVPPSKYAAEMGKGLHLAEFQEMTSQVEADQSEEYQQRSDAEMEINSEVEIKQDGLGQQCLPTCLNLFYVLLTRESYLLRYW